MPKKDKEVVAQTADEEVDEGEDAPKITCDEFERERLYFKANKLDKEAGQLMCFPKYLYDKNLPLTAENFEKKSDNFILVTDPIKIVRGGIPRHNTQYHGPDPDSMKRSYFYIPKNIEDEGSKKLFDTIAAIDDFMDEEINEKGNENGILCYLNKDKKRIKLKSITYVRMETTAKPGTDFNFEEEEEEEDSGSKKNKKNTKGKKEEKKEDKKEFVPWNRVKVRFATLYDADAKIDALKDITTQVYVGDSEEPEKTKTVTDIEKYFSWNCTAQFALMFYKVWIDKKDDKKCSISIKCLQIGVTELSEFKKGTSLSKQLNKKLFASAPSSSSSKKESKESQKSSKQTKKQKSDEESDDDKGSDQDESDQDEKGSDQDDEKGSDDDKSEVDDQDASEPESEEEDKSKKTNKKTNKTQSKDSKSSKVESKDMKVKGKNDKSSKTPSKDKKAETGKQDKKKK
jgi:hypothetical protein